MNVIIVYYTIYLEDFKLYYYEDLIDHKKIFCKKESIIMKNLFN